MKTKFSVYKNQGQNKTITHQGPCALKCGVWSCVTIYHSRSPIWMISIMLLARVPTEYKLAFLGFNRPRFAKWFDSSFILKHLVWTIEGKHTLWSHLEKSIETTLEDKEKFFYSFWWHILLNRVIPWRCKYVYKVNFDSNMIVSTCIMTVFAHWELPHVLWWQCSKCSGSPFRE